MRRAANYCSRHTPCAGFRTRSVRRTLVLVLCQLGELGWHALRYSEGREPLPTPFGVPQGVPPDGLRTRSVRATLVLTDAFGSLRPHLGWFVAEQLPSGFQVIAQNLH